MTEAVLQDDSATAIIQAIEANLYAFGTSQLARWSRTTVYDEPQLLWFKSDFSYAMFNVAQRARLSSDNVDRIIVELQTRYGERNLPISWWVGPSSTPVEISRHLTSAGFIPAGETAGMAMDILDLNGPPQPGNLSVRPTTDTLSLDIFARTMCQGFQLRETIMEPMIDQAMKVGVGTDRPLINYVGYLNGHPVATSSLYLNSGVAGIYNVSTLPARRRRGIGSAVTMATLLEAARRDYRIAILHASTMSRSMYARLGFYTYCYFHQYLWPAPGEKNKA